MTYPIQALLNMRAEKDREFKQSPYSPLTPEQQQIFSALSYFEPNPDLSVEVEPTEFSKKDPVRMMTSKNEIRSYLRWGTVSFLVEGQPVTLTLYFVPGQNAFFLPFMDGTTGTESYGAGRYVEVERQPNGKIHIDFNQAYNPYCAYNDQWSCPLVPAENRVTVPIHAGERAPVGDWLEKAHD